MHRIDQEWLNQPATQRVFDVYEKAGFQIFAVGGCVRNSVMELPTTDIDLATNAEPQVGMKLADAVGFRVIPTGIDHGTITIVVDGVPFEITTYRKDVDTDGRRAVVAFSDNKKDDAMRRDFTMNALYADRNGRVFDPLGGLPDTVARSVRFIGNAHDRIKEDSLRILRFFRFYALYGDHTNGLDVDGLSACAELQDQMDHLSRERVGTELAKLLGAGDPSIAIAAMMQTGILTRILAGADATSLPVLVHFERRHAIAPNAMRRLAALTSANTQVILALSNHLSKEHQLIATNARDGIELHEFAYRYGGDIAVSVALVRAALIEVPPTSETFDLIKTAANQKFPIKAADFMDRFSGKALGDALKSREKDWIASNFSLTREQLLG